MCRSCTHAPFDKSRNVPQKMVCYTLRVGISRIFRPYRSICVEILIVVTFDFQMYLPQYRQPLTQPKSRCRYDHYDHCVCGSCHCLSFGVPNFWKPVNLKLKAYQSPEFLKPNKPRAPKITQPLTIPYARITEKSVRSNPNSWRSLERHSEQKSAKL